MKETKKQLIQSSVLLQLSNRKSNKDNEGDNAITDDNLKTIFNHMKS